MRNDTPDTPTRGRDRAGRVALLVGLLLLSTVAGGATVAGTALAQVDAAERSLETTAADPGETVAVELEVTVDERGDRLTVVDDPTGDVADAEAGTVAYNGEPVDPEVFAVDADGATVALEEQFEAGDTVTVAYAVTLADDATGSVAFDGEAGIDDRADVPVGGDGRLDVDADVVEPVDAATRAIDSDDADPGETVAVELAVDFDERGDRLTVFENYGSVDDAELTAVRRDGDAVEPALAAVDDEGLTVALEGSFEPDDAVVLEYAVTVAQDADDGDAVAFEGVAGADAQDGLAIGGDESIAVSDDGDSSGSGGGSIGTPGGGSGAGDGDGADANSTLTVTVVDDDGNPLADATVRVGDRTAATDADGTATLALADGEYELGVDADGFDPAVETVALEGDSAVTVALEELEDASDAPEDDEGENGDATEGDDAPQDGDGDGDGSNDSVSGFGTAAALLAVALVIGYGIRFRSGS